MIQRRSRFYGHRYGRDFRYAILATRPHCITLHLSPDALRNLARTQIELPSSDEHLATLVVAWSKEHDEAQRIDRASYKVYVQHLQGELMKYRICSIRLDEFPYFHDSHRIDELQAAVTARFDGDRITQESQVRMKVQFGSFEKSGEQTPGSFRISDLTCSAAELRKAEAYVIDLRYPEIRKVSQHDTFRRQNTPPKSSMPLPDDVNSSVSPYSTQSTTSASPSGLPSTSILHHPTSSPSWLSRFQSLVRPYPQPGSAPTPPPTETSTSTTDHLRLPPIFDPPPSLATVQITPSSSFPLYTWPNLTEQNSLGRSTTASPNRSQAITLPKATAKPPNTQHASIEAEDLSAKAPATTIKVKYAAPPSLLAFRFKSCSGYTWPGLAKPARILPPTRPQRKTTDKSTVAHSVAIDSKSPTAGVAVPDIENRPKLTVPSADPPGPTLDIDSLAPTRTIRRSYFASKFTVGYDSGSKASSTSDELLQRGRNLPSVRKTSQLPQAAEKDLDDLTAGLAKTKLAPPTVQDVEVYKITA